MFDKNNFEISIVEHLEWASVKPVHETLEKTKPLYESLHIVDIFNDAIEVIGQYIYTLYEKKKLWTISKEKDILLSTKYWFNPGNGNLIKSKREVDGSIRLKILFKHEEDGSKVMEAEPQEAYPKNLVISVYPYSIIEMFSSDKLSSKSKRKEFIKMTLKHEFKHLRTIWAVPGRDVLSAKKYAREVRMTPNERKVAARGYTIFDTRDLLYFLNPEEALAFINGIFYKIENTSDEDLRAMLSSLENSGKYNSNKIFALIDNLDDNYYFGQIKNLIDKLKSDKCIKDKMKRYEVYNFLIHAKELGIFKELRDFPSEDVSFQEFIGMPIEDQMSSYDGVIRSIEMCTLEIRRKLFNAVYDLLKRRNLV